LLPESKLFLARIASQHQTAMSSTRPSPGLAPAGARGRLERTRRCTQQPSRSPTDGTATATTRLRRVVLAPRPHHRPGLAPQARRRPARASSASLARHLPSLVTCAFYGARPGGRPREPSGPLASRMRAADMPPDAGESDTGLRILVLGVSRRGRLRLIRPKYR
jgi:hypothetical protein